MGWDMVRKSRQVTQSVATELLKKAGNPPFREEVIVGEDNIVGSTYIYTLW